MTKFPNQEGLNRALNIYRSAMRSFIISRLRQIKNVEDIVIDSLEDARQFERVDEIERILLQSNRNIESVIDINDFPHLVNKNWANAFKGILNDDKTFRNQLWLIVECRNADWAHPPEGDAEPESTRVHLFHIADVLGKISKQDARDEVKGIRDQLFSYEVEEHVSDVSDQLETARAKTIELEKLLKDKSDRLEEMESKRATYEKRLETASFQLKIAVAGKTVAEERLSDISNRFEEAEVENAELKKRLSEKGNRLRTVKEELSELKEPLPQNPNILDFVIFQGTTFIKHLDKYRVVGDAITQSFWNYWRSLGSEGKEEMRDAGWSVEKVDDDYWEITVSPEDFEAWVEEDDEPLGPSTQPSYERTSLPTVKEMVEPALELFVDKKEHRRVEMINLLTEHFSLDDEERRYISKTGQVEKHLMKEGLIERTRTGYYRITSRGLEVLGKNSSRGRNNKTDRTREAPDSYTKRTRVKRTNLPTGKEMEQPALEFLRDGREYPRIEIIDVLTDHFSLTKDQREVLSQSGRVELYLRNNGLIERTKTGYYRITDLGLEILK